MSFNLLWRIALIIIVYSFPYAGRSAYAAEDTQRIDAGRSAYAAEDTQRIEDFYLCNYTEDGAQEWELKGERAFVRDRYVDIDNMEAKYYSTDGTVYVTSKWATLDKHNMNVCLKGDVHVRTDQGMTLVTDYLDWKNDENMISTDDRVKLRDDALKIRARGMTASTKLKNVRFAEDVEVEIFDKKKDEITVITCDGPLTIIETEGKAIFYNNVVVEHVEARMFADRVTVLFDRDIEEIHKIISDGNVRIIKGNNLTRGQQAIYYGETRKVVVRGEPELIYVPKEGEDKPKF